MELAPPHAAALGVSSDNVAGWLGVTGANLRRSGVKRTPAHRDPPAAFS